MALYRQVFPGCEGHVAEESELMLGAARPTAGVSREIAIANAAAAADANKCARKKFSVLQALNELMVLAMIPSV